MRTAIVALILAALAAGARCGADTIAWENGAVWQNVKVTEFRTANAKSEFYVEPTAASLPSSIKEGWYSGARRIEFKAAAADPTTAVTKAASAYPPIEARAMEIIQPDTLRLDTGQKVKLLGVDSPKTTDPDRPLEYFGREAFLYAKKKAEGQQVRIEFDQRRMDNYGQLLGYVYLSDGTFLNLDLVQTGHAHAWLGEPMSESAAARFREAEASARRGQAGLWNVDKRETATRGWQFAEPSLAAGSSSSRRSNESSLSSSPSYDRPTRTGRRPINVDIDYSETPVPMWTPFGIGFGRQTTLTVQPH